MPWFIGISGDLRLILRISNDKSVIMTVFRKPFAIRGISKAFLQRAIHRLTGHINSQSRLMLTAARLCGHKIGR